jgi:hypothetical protein
LLDALDVSTAVLDDLAVQLEVADPSWVKRYTERRPTRCALAKDYPVLEADVAHLSAYVRKQNQTTNEPHRGGPSMR